MHVPVAKVDPLDVELGKLLARAGGDEQIEQRVLDVACAMCQLYWTEELPSHTMTPVLSLDGTQACDVASSEGGCRAGPEDKQDKAGQPNVAELKDRRHR